MKCARNRREALALLALLAMTACQSRSVSVVTESPDQVLVRLSRQGYAVGASLGTGAVRYLGFEAFPVGAFPGDEVTVVHYWVASRPLESRYRVFVHALLEGAHGWIPHGDYDPTPPTDSWPVGRVIRNEHRVELPQDLPGRSVGLRVGLYRGETRMPIDDSQHDDGSGRVRAGSFAVSGNGVPLPVYQAPRLQSPPVIDGDFTDPVWKEVPWIEGFTPSRGRGRARVRTRARLAWDPETLYIAFEAEDPDILASMSKRDAPVYREEAVEIFIDPQGLGRAYVELQVNPLAARFDAAFSGGARSNMRTAFDADYEVAVKINGTVAAPGSASRPEDVDHGWRSEWAVRIRSLPGVNGALAVGQRWRINLFRVAKDRRAGRVEPDESAWSPPLMGDFHNLERFGQLWFVDDVTAGAGPAPNP